MGSKCQREIFFRRAVLVAALLACAPLCRAQQLPAAAADAFVVSNMQFVLMHELAHLVIDEKKIPIVGPEETAADYLATMMLIRPRWSRPPGDELLLKIAVLTGDGFAIAWQRAASLDSPIAYWGAHALTVQRFSTVACLVYGSNPQRFAALPGLAGMPVARAAGCPEEFAKAELAVDWLFDHYARLPGEPPGAPVSIDIEPAPSRTSQRLFAAWQQSGLIDGTFARLGQFFALDRPFTFSVRSCHAPQARWVAATRELVFCYELLDAYAVLARDEHREAIESLFSNGGEKPARELLNSERIERTFGSYGVEVLAATPTSRVSSLYSLDGSERVCRTFAVVRYPRRQDPRLAREHERILAGGSIGATFAADGWSVDKTHRYLGELPASERVAKLMHIEPGTPVAVDVYVLDVDQGAAPIEYATIAELHHPDYLKLADLEMLYGEPSVDAPADRRSVRDMLDFVRRQMR